jgi:hypothetical protein
MGYSREIITLEDLWEEYDNKALYGLYAACCLLPAVLSDIGFDVNAMMESGTTQERDMYNGASYRGAMQRMLATFEGQGVFRASETPSTNEVNTA